MKTKIIKPINLMLMLLLAAAFAMPTAVEAGRGHHRFGHSHHHPQHHHYEHHDHRHVHHQRHHRKHHYKRRHNAYYGGYNRVYNPPRHFANRRYYQPRPQQYGYGRNYPPAPVYGYPTNGMLGIHTGNARFMVRY